MARSPFDKLKDATTGAIGIGRTVAGQLVKAAGPRISRSAGVVISHLPRYKPAPAPVREPSTAANPPVTKAPVTKAPAAKVSATEPAKRVSASDAAPTPAAVAKNISKHPPTKPAAKKAPAKRSVPGAKLPPKKTEKKTAAVPDKR